MTKFTKFLADDAGAVTIDWVALTAGILLLGIMVVYAIFNNGVSSLVSSVNSTLKNAGSGVNIGTLENQNPEAPSLKSDFEGRVQGGRPFALRKLVAASHTRASERSTGQTDNTVSRSRTGVAFGSIICAPNLPQPLLRISIIGLSAMTCSPDCSHL